MEEGLVEKDDNCIICLDECMENNYLKFPISKSTCQCKYNMHVKCYKQFKPGKHVFVNFLLFLLFQ